MKKNLLFFGLLILVIVITGVVLFVRLRPTELYTDWKVYGGSKTRIQYSALSQIDTNNVGSLRVSWVYHTGDAEGASQMQANPIVVDGVLYGVSPKLKLIALDPASGKERWVFDPFADTSSGRKPGGINMCRGVSFYDGGKSDKKIFYTVGSLLYCINPSTGQPWNSFGTNGTVDLHNDLGKNVKDLFITSTSPGMIYRDLVIIGSYVSEEAAAAPGHIRAYDVHTGKLRWIFHTIPHPGEQGYEEWVDKEAYQHIGGANSWAGFTLDESTGLLYAPTGSASYDFYGGKRLGKNLFANCILALDAASGKLRWYFQTVHHDVWDWDLPAPPALVRITKEGEKIDALVQVTKTGFLFVLDRKTGKPLYPIEERLVPVETDLAGEKLSTTQPCPTFYPPFVRQTVSDTELNRDIPDSSYQEIRQQLATYITGNLFNPPSKKPTIIFPGMQGGAEWGGPCYDPGTGIVYINANEVPRLLTMVERKEKLMTSNQNNLEAGKALYNITCINCHGPERKGGGDFPPLLGLEKKYSDADFKNLITTGRRRMPGFNQLGEGEKNALASFILNIKSLQRQKFIPSSKKQDPYFKIPYTSMGSARPTRFETREGYPAIRPPWGSLSAINLNSGKIVWKIPLGDYPELKAKGIQSGTENYGGPVLTAGGLLFIAATKDGKFRAFNKRSGQLLWETDLPAPGFATPSIFEANGKEYVVIACGGGKMKTKSGDAYVAFSLPGN
ncbi:MAG TPA: PQQ-binding-like beta-propeller repeat protein [Flavisolibacter sp.]|jgi:quinoprotein glucose dehydrogenase|nr:PQQ-binding-like beta-propeller repeat protein [Flavisolibacter sp.]